MPAATKPDQAQVHAVIDALSFWRHFVTQPEGPKPWNETGVLYGDGDEPSRKRRYLARLDKARSEHDAMIDGAQPEPEPKPKRSKPAKAEPVKVEMTDDGYAEAEPEAQAS